MAKQPYKMSLSLSVLDDLGINLYSNIPAVLSEIVANAWDADAEIVDITFSPNGDEIIIKDDGIGMNILDINEKYLTVGYKRREHIGGEKTPKGRDVMGRKGIGKLSVFSIAENVRIYTTKNGQKNAFEMVLPDIRAAIIRSTDYFPKSLPLSNVNFRNGTKIILTKIKKDLIRTEPALRRRLARRFSIIGDEFGFNVKINGKSISIEDRDYFHKIQFLWYYGKDSEKYKKECNKGKLKNDELRLNNSVSVGSEKFEVKGWIGTVDNSGDLKDTEADESLNKIVVMARGKLAQEDILSDFSEGGLFSKYVFGEIHAEFLDLNNKEDISTTSRQKLRENNERYQALSEFVHSELKHIQSKWTELRNVQGEKKALEIPEIKEWMSKLSSDHKNRAKSLFGKINQLTLNPEEKKDIFKYCVLAFETLRYKGNLDSLENISTENIGALALIFQDVSDVEAALYYQIVKERLEVIKILEKKVDKNAREKIIQKHLFKELWLLDPSWERATETPRMEEQVSKEFGKIDAKLTPEEKKGRIDIRYKTTAGKHIIIELKRPEVVTSTVKLLEQCQKYIAALKKVLKNTKNERLEVEQIEAICVVGMPLSDWKDEKERSERTLSVSNIRVVLYDQLINNAQKAYKDYLDKEKVAGAVFELISKLDTKNFFN